MNTNLTDFSKDELNTLLSAVANYMMDQEGHAGYYERYLLDSTPPFAATYHKAKRQVTNCQTLTVQIMNALSIVSDREILSVN